MPGDADADHRRHARRQQHGRRADDRRGTSRPRVLLVEPHEDTRTLYAWLFEEADYAVHAVADGGSARRVSEQRLPDLVVLEVVVPVIDGFGILQALRSGPATADVPAIVVTSMLHYDVPRRARESGATVVLAKPTSPDVLLRAADDLLAATPPARFARRQLRRALLTFQHLGQHMEPDAIERARDRLKHLIDRLQVAVLAVDDDARCIAVSRGFESLTGFDRADLLRYTLYHTAFGTTLPLAYQWDQFLSDRQELGDLTIRNREGHELPVQMAMATVAPGLHLAAFAAR